MNSDEKEKLSQVIEFLEKGNLIDSKKILEDLLIKNPNEFDLIHLLAVTYASTGNHKEALNYYQKAYEFNKKNQYHLSNWASSLNSIGLNQEALSLINNAIKINPDNSEFWFNAGNILIDLENNEEAINFLKTAIKLNPNFYQAYNNLGRIYFKLGQYEQSIKCYDKALTLSPNFIECLCNKGILLSKIKHYDTAINVFNKILNISPFYPEALLNFGIVMYQLIRYEEAIEYFNKALSLQPDMTDAWLHKGLTLLSTKKYIDAIFHFDKVISINQKYSEAWAYKGLASYELFDFETAVYCYDKALFLKKDFEWLFGDLLHTKLQMCNWHGVSEICLAFFQKIIEGAKVTTPWYLLSLSDDPSLHKKATQIYVDSIYPEDLDLELLHKKNKKNKIHIGYFSADFCAHPVSFLIAEIIKLHNRDLFKITAFSCGADDKSEIRSRLIDYFDDFIDVSKRLDKEIAELSRDMKVDIAIDLGGFTRNARFGIFSYRAAPIQVSWLGYPGSTQSDYIDYIIADKVVIPKSNQKFYSEKIIYLPNTYITDDSTRTSSPRVFSREECGLKKDAFVYCCFNNSYKINEQQLDSWARILLLTKNSVLWLSRNNDVATKNLLNEFKKRGIESNRIIFAEKLDSMGDYLARYALVDLFLDTSPYNAHTTALDALKTGTPIITYMGNTFASRVGASLLNAVGLPELIAFTREQYENLAIDYALTPEKLNISKSKLKINLLCSPLFNSSLFTKNLEEAYVKIYDRFHDNLKPDHLTIN